MSTSNNPQAYQMSLNELTRELQRNLTEQLNNYRVQSSSSSYGYTSGSSGGGGSADFESMKNQLQNQLMQQLQQGLQKQYRYSASASYSASSSSSSNANYGTHQSYGNYANVNPNNRYKRFTHFFDPSGHHSSYDSAKSSRAYSTNSRYSSHEQNRGMNFLLHTRDSQPLEFGDSMNFGRTSGNYFQSTYSKGNKSFGDNSQEVVEDVVASNHQVESPQKLYMTAEHQVEMGRPNHNCPHHSEIPESHHKMHAEKFTDQELSGQQEEDDLQQLSEPVGHYGQSRYQANNKFQLPGHKFTHHIQFTGQEDIEEPQIPGDSKNYLTQQLQTDDSQNQFKFTHDHQLPEQQSQEDLDQNPQLSEQQSQEVELELPKKPMQSTYFQQPGQHLEVQENLSQQLEQEPQLQQKVQKPVFTTLHQQHIEDLNSRKVEIDQEVDDQNELPEELEISNSQKLMNGIPKNNQEQQQVEEELLPKPYHGQPAGNLQGEFTEKLDQSEDDFTQQLEFHGSKYPLETDGQPIEDLQTQQVQLSHHKPEELQEQDNFSQQEVQDDLTQQIQLTDARTPNNKLKYTGEQELEQQSEIDSANLISKKSNLQSEQQELVDQDDLTQQLEVGGAQKTAQLSESDLSQQIELAKKPEPSEQNLISVDQFEDQDNSEPNLLTQPKKKPNYDQSQVEQSEEDMTQQLILSNNPNPKSTQEQELTGQTKADLDQQLENDGTQNQEIQEPDDTQQLESKPSLEPIERKFERNHQDHSEDDASQHLELIDFHKPNKSKPFHEQEIENNLKQRLELTRSQKPSPIDQRVQEQQHLDSTPKDIQDKQTEEQQLEDDLTQQLEPDNIRINRKPNYSPNFRQELENDQDQQLELRGVHKPQKNEPREQQQQTQLQSTETDQTESKRNQQNEEILQELSNIDHNVELTHETPKNESPDQEQLTVQTKDNTQHEISYGYSTQHSSESHTTINPTTMTDRRPESHVDSSSERSFTNGHNGYTSSKATGLTYEEALRQQNALLDLLKQKIQGQPDSQSTHDRTTIKKTMYGNENPVGIFDQTRFIQPNGEIIRIGEASPAQTRTYGHSNQDIDKTLGYGENDMSKTTYPVHVNNPIVQSTFTSQTSRRVYHFVNGKPVSATEYVRIVKPNGKIVENKYEIPLSLDLPTQNEFSPGLSSSHMAGSSRTYNHFSQSMEGTENIPLTQNFKQYELSQGIPSQYSINTAAGMKTPSHYDDIHSTEDLRRQNQFSHGLPPSQFSQNMEDHFQVGGSRTTNHFGQIVEGKHNILSMDDLLRQNQFPQGTSPGQFSHNIHDNGLGLTSNSFGQNVNAFNDALRKSGFTGQASKKTSYYVNGKLVSSSETKQITKPNGKITEMISGSDPSGVGSVEQQIADLQGTYTGHKSKNTSRHGIKTSRHTRRISY